MNIATEEAFLDALSSDLTWRIREISDLKTAAKSSTKSVRTSLVRALLTLGYAHFEGHIKFSGTIYHKYVARRKFALKELHPHFVEAQYWRKISKIQSSGISFEEFQKLIIEMIEHENVRYTKISENFIDTQSNLNSVLLSNICKKCNLDLSLATSNRDFIDQLLLSRRNSIAHGERVDYEIDDLDDFVDRLIGIMRSFSDSITNNVTLKSYLRVVHV